MSSIAAQPSPTIQVSYNFKGVQQEFKISIDAKPLIDINHVSRDPLNCNTSFGYVGVHDHGSLPRLKFDQVNGNIISCLQEAKRACDDILTDCMKDESETPAKTLSSNQLEKKPRLDSI